MGHGGTGGEFAFLPEGSYTDNDVTRLRWRYRHIVAPIRSLLDGAEVLDLGSYDGRWPYAFAEAGATVTGIEGRRNLMDRFGQFPEGEAKSRVTLVEGDFVEQMGRLIAEGRTFDVVACLGVFYHTMDHYRMLLQMVQFEPRLIIVDSVFHLAKRPLMRIGLERTDVRRNAIPQMEGQTRVPIGRLSRPALRLMVDSVGYRLQWVDWKVPPAERDSVIDYFEHENAMLRRCTAFVRPAERANETA